MIQKNMGKSVVGKSNSGIKSEQGSQDTVHGLNIKKGTENMAKCTELNKEDRVVIITDKETLAVGKGIAKAAKKAGVKGENIVFLLMEDLGERPLTSLPDGVRNRITEIKPTKSFFAATMKDGELGFRKPLMTMLAKEFNVAHAHMPGITNEVAGGEAMCANYDEIYRVTHAVLEIVKNAKTMQVTAPNGTTLAFEFDPENLRWFPCDGKITRGMFSNLPDGEVFTTPLNVNGTLVTSLLGDHFCKKYGILKTPVTIEIKDGFAVSVSCENKELEAEVKEYLFRGENTNRVGEGAIGTNVAVRALIGNMLADEKAKGVHIAFGDPLGDETGATWTVNPAQHCDMVVQGCTITVDGKQIMKNGNFLV